MKIQMACNAGGHFRRGFIDKYPDIDFTFYTNPLKTAFFFGCYGEIQLQQAKDHKGKLYLCWTGGDIRYLKKHPELVELVRGENIIHIAISNFIEKDLKEFGLDYICAPILPFKTEFSPVPLGDSIYIYKSQHSLYGRELNNKIKERLPDIHFIESEFGVHSREEMQYIYGRCFTGLRLTSHDGLSNTVCEMGLMGRKVIWNGNTPNALAWTDEDSIIQAIELARKAKPHKVADDMRHYLKNDLIEKIAEQWQ